MTIQLAVSLAGSGQPSKVACGLHDFFAHLRESPVPLDTGSTVLVAPTRASADQDAAIALGTALAGLECGRRDAVDWALAQRQAGNHAADLLALRFLTRAGRWNEALDLARDVHGLEGDVRAALTPAPAEPERDRLLRIARLDALLGPPRAAPPLIEEFLSNTWDTELARALVVGLLADGNIERAMVIVQKLRPDDPLQGAVVEEAQEHLRQRALAQPASDSW